MARDVSYHLLYRRHFLYDMAHERYAADDMSRRLPAEARATFSLRFSRRRNARDALFDGADKTSACIFIRCRGASATCHFLFRLGHTPRAPTLSLSFLSKQLHFSLFTTTRHFVSKKQAAARLGTMFLYTCRIYFITRPTASSILPRATRMPITACFDGDCRAYAERGYVDASAIDKR